MHLLAPPPSRSFSVFRWRSTARVLSRSFSRDYVQVEKEAGEKINVASYDDGPLVICGISGRFPNATSVKELTSKLLQGQELISETSCRWADEQLPKRIGLLSCLDKFDAGFFGNTPHQVNQLDPQIRLLLEVAFEAVIDAGLNPTSFRGSRTAVFSGAYGGEALSYFEMRLNRDSVGQYGSHSFMIPARLAFHLDLWGPSSDVATACFSSLKSLQTAVLCIQSGDCEAAIVTGSTVHLSPNSHVDLLALNALAKDGRCKAYEESVDRFGRAEAAVAIVIQKEKDALRNYAQILSIRFMSDGFKNAGIMYPSRESQEVLLKECYFKAGMDLCQVLYVEAHGTGTPSGDPEELHALHSVLCKGRDPGHPLQVGSIKTNIERTEGAAGRNDSSLDSTD